jgi:hypothetical protein
VKPAADAARLALLVERSMGFGFGVLFQLEGSKAMDFRPLNDVERRQLISALRGNAESDRAILMDRRTTTFAGTADEVTDEEVISAIKSVPCHY